MSKHSTSARTSFSKNFTWCERIAHPLVIHPVNYACACGALALRTVPPRVRSRPWRHPSLSPMHRRETCEGPGETRGDPPGSGKAATTSSMGWCRWFTPSALSSMIDLVDFDPEGRTAEIRPAAARAFTGDDRMGS